MLGPRLNLKTSLKYLPIPPLIFTGVKNANFASIFRLESPLSRRHFETEQQSEIHSNTLGAQSAKFGDNDWPMKLTLQI